MKPKVVSAVFFLLSGYLLLGIAHIAALPPWEGFDETAHYSYLQQIADTWGFPRLEAARISKDVERYVRFAPIPYSSDPPFENNGGFTYKSFFEAPEETVVRGKEYIHNRPTKARHYAEGTSRNWQAQHPPLYYLLLSPVYAATRHLSWGAHLFILRFASYLFAWSALMLAFYSFFTAASGDLTHQEITRYHWGMLGVGIWPVLFPQWFPEMARLGNDSLCALIMSMVWLVTIRVLNTGQGARYSIILGVLLGLGCLTKALFVPITVGVVSFWVFRRLCLEGRKALQSVLSHTFLTCALIACIAGWWYMGNWLRHGIALGTFDMISLNNAGGMAHGLAKNLTVTALLRGHAAFVATFAWCGTWSLVRPPYVYLAPMVFTVVFAAAAYLSTLRRSQLLSMEWLPVWLVVPVLAGLSHHVLLQIALAGQGRGTGGWYLHLLVVPLGVAVGHGFGAWWNKSSFRTITGVLSLYAVLFSICISRLQLLLFSGLVFKSGTNKFYQFPESLPSFLGLPDAISRLGVIAFPGLGFITWMCGGILVAIGLILTWRSTHALRTGPPYPPCPYG
ncbi:MAG: hypothetical protein JRI22_07055 [Deltaproteobacteria bacterium]|nr:hypothetical protein [Deltaproteobacteria bacterium]